jgi:hypothetical protein
MTLKPTDVIIGKVKLSWSDGTGHQMERTYLRMKPEKHKAKERMRDKG